MLLKPGVVWLSLIAGCSQNLATQACVRQAQEGLRGAVGSIEAGKVVQMPAQRRDGASRYVVEVNYSTWNQRGERVHRKSSCNVEVAEHGQAFVGRLHY